MNNKYIHENMRKNFLIMNSYLKVIFFLFLILGFSKIMNSQCITPGDTTLCYGDEITYCVNNTQLPPHDSIRIEYDFFAHNTWDGNGEFGGGQDFWYCVVSQDTIFRTTFSNTGSFGNFQSFPDQFVDGNIPPFQQCNGVWPPSPVNANPGYSGAVQVGAGAAKYRLSHTMAHNSGVAIIDFISGLNEAASNESWSMDDVVISLWNNNTGWQTYFEESFDFSIGPQWDAASNTNCNYPLLPTSIFSYITFNGQSGIGPFIQNTRIRLDLGLIPNTSSSASSVLWSTGDTTSCISVMPTNTTIYSVVVQDSAGTVTCQDSVTVTIHPQLNISSLVNNPSSQSACNGAIFLSISGGQPPYNYQWDTSGVNIAGGAVLQSLCENTYCVEITDSSGTGCSTDTCFNVEWNPCNIIDSVVSEIACNGGTGTVRIELDTISGHGPDTTYLPGPRFVVNIYTVNPYFLVNSIQTNNTTSFIPLPANDYIVSIYDNSWNDSCYTNFTLSEPDPIIINTTVTNTSFPYVDDGTITIDSISGGTEPFVSIDWFDNSIFPPVLIATGDTIVDSLSYANPFTGGYQISVIDTNGCTGDTIIYIDPNNAETSFAIASADSLPPSCANICDAQYSVQMFNVGTHSIPPFNYILTDLISGSIISIDSLGTANYNNNTHSVSYTDLCDGVYQIEVFDYYGNGPVVAEFFVIDPIPVQVDLGPDFIIPCGEDTILRATASGGNIINDTTLISNDPEVLTFGSSATAFTDSLSAGKEYLLVVSGTYQDNQGNTFDAAYNTATQAPVMDWLLGTTNTHRPFPDVFQPSSTYNFVFSGFNGVQQIVLPATSTLSGQLSFRLYEISVDTTIYSYSWTTNPPGGPNPPVVSDADTVLAYPGVNATDYMLTVTDQNGCPGIDTVNVSWDLFILDIDNIIVSNVGCNGQATGYIAIDVDTTLGFPPYNYFVNNNLTNDTTFNLTIGTYTVSISDDIGCLSETDTVQIIENDSLYACIDPINFVAVEVDNFSLFFDTANSHTTVQTQLGLQYELVVSGVFFDTLWNDYQDAAYIYNPNIIAHNPNPWSWNGDFNVRPDVNIYSANHTYTYTFTGDGNGQIFSYVDLFGDYFGSGGQLDFVLYKKVCPDSDTAYTCFGDNTAFATIYPNGGVPFVDMLGQSYYEYEWRDDQGNIVNSNATATGLFAGSYTITVIDAVGCTYDRELVVIQPVNALYIDTNSYATNVECNGDSVASITVLNSGGFSFTPTLSVLLHNTGNSNDTIATYSGFNVDSIIFDSLSFGTYTYYLYDSVPDNLYGDYMCPQMMQFSITEPLPIITSISNSYGVTCFGDSSGGAKVDVIGGVGPYTYRWDNAPFGPDSLGENSSQAFHLWADTSLPFPGAMWHYVTITDALGCERIDSVEIEHLNTKIRPFYIDDFGNLIYSINIIEDSVTCHSDEDGIAALSTLGGVLPHTYTWDVLEPGNSGLNHTSMNQPDTVDYLSEGGHDIIVIDDVGCEMVVRFRIYEPDPIYAIGTLTTPISCFGYNNGSAQVYGVGGNDIPPASYTYTWQLDPNLYSALDDSIFWAGDTNNLGQSLNNQFAQFTDSIFVPGSHVVTVTDYKGCFDSDTVEFIEPSLLTLEFTDTTYAYCEFTESAALCVQAFGGTENYTYQFNDQYHQNNAGNGTGANTPFCADNLTPFNTNTAPGVPVGDYYVTVLDNRGCFADNYIDIDSVTNTFNTDSVEYVWSHLSCFNSSDGSIDINNITGGNGSFPGGYTIAWVGPNGYTNNIFNISSLQAGSYAATISDSPVGLGQSCDVTINVVISEPAQLLVAVYDTTTPTCIGDGYNNAPTSPTTEGSCDGQILVSITGGTGPYYYDTSEQGIYPLTTTMQIPTGDTLIDDMCAGFHTIYITDANGCQGFPAPAGISTATLDIGLLVTADVTSLVGASCADTSDGSAIVNNPNPLFDYTWETNNPGPPPGFPQGDAPSGTILGTGNSYHSFYPDYYWLVAHYSPASNFGLPIEGCDATAPINILQLSPPPITYNIAIIQPTCFGDNDGEIFIDPILIGGGNGGPYDFEWDTTIAYPIQVDFNPLPNLISGTYTVTIYDNSGCNITDAIFVDQPTQIQNNFTTTNTSCNGLSDGTITASTTGGTPGYNYIGLTGAGPWNGGAGEYIVEVVDANGCSVLDTAYIDEPDALTISLNSNIDYGSYHVSCNGASDGEIIAVVTGGTLPYDYDWSNGQTNNPATGLFTGLLSVDVTDNNDCKISDNITLLEPDPIFANPSDNLNDWGFHVSCFGGNDGYIELNSTGGIPNNTDAGYEYTWTSNNGSDIDHIWVEDDGVFDYSTAINLFAIPVSYTVTIEASYGCSKDTTFELTSPSEIFDPFVDHINYAGPGKAPYNIIFQDFTEDSNGPMPVTDVSHAWCWDPVFESAWPKDTSCNGSLQDYPLTTTQFSHPFTDVGINDAYVIITNENTGCNKKIHFTIHVQGMLDTIPNVFTPNGDDWNDIFSFGDFGMDDMSVSIYNRWGQQVYSWEGNNGSWNGKGVDGQDLSEGVYFWVLKAKGMDGYYYEDKGSVTLIRD